MAAAKQTKTIRVTRTGSPIRRPKVQKATLTGLGLTRMNQTRELPDTPAIRGMIARVGHIVRVDD